MITLRFVTFCALTLVVTAQPAVAHPYDTAHDDDGCVTVNGERRFILGSYTYRTPDNDMNPARSVDELSEAGFNLVYVGGYHERNVNSLIAAAAAHARGMLTWTSVGAPKNMWYESRVRGAVKRAALTPGLGMVETVDEPAWSLRKPEDRVGPEAVARSYEMIKEYLPNTLVYTNHASTNLVSTLQKYNAGTDVVAVDIYPVNPGVTGQDEVLHPDGLQGDLNNIYISQVGEYVRKMRAVAGPGRPVFCVQQGFAWERLNPPLKRDWSKIVYPTFDEIRFMAYQAIIEGANGIMYWGQHTTPRDSEFWANLVKVVGELASFEDVLVARNANVQLDIEYHEVGYSVDDGVSVLVKDVGDVRYVLTCNADRYPCRATISGLGDWTRAVVLDEDRRLWMRRGAVRDEWDAFGVHIYRLER